MDTIQDQQLAIKVKDERECVYYDIIGKLTSRLKELEKGEVDNRLQWQNEKERILGAQHEVQTVCQEQLQSFYELNKKSQVVIERLETELLEALLTYIHMISARKELERTNRVIHQQHEMYYQLYNHKNHHHASPMILDDLPLTEKFIDTGNHLLYNTFTGKGSLSSQYKKSKRIGSVDKSNNLSAIKQLKGGYSSFVAAASRNEVFKATPKSTRKGTRVSSILGGGVKGKENLTKSFIN